MSWTQALVLLMEVALKSGGVAKLNEFFSRHKDELLALRASLRRPPRPKGL